MAILQIIADRPRSGKTCVAGALLAHLAEGGKRVGYYKPFSRAPAVDPDVSFVYHSLLSGTGAPEVPEPHPMPPLIDGGPSLAPPLAGEIQSESARLEGAADVVVMEGPDLALPGGGISSLPLELAALVDSRVVLLFGYRKDLDAGAMGDAMGRFAGRLAGVIVNGVTAYRGREAARALAASQPANGPPAMGMLPEDRSMLGVTAHQIAGHLGGRWAQEPGSTEVCVDRFLIGGNIMDTGPTYFGRSPNEAVITRAARPDIQMASMMAGTRCLVLTGGEGPTEYVKADALQRDVPLILVEGSTLDTAEALGGLLDRASAHSVQKTRRFLQLMRRHLDLDALTAFA